MTTITHYCNTPLQHSTSSHCCNTLPQHTTTSHYCNTLLQHPNSSTLLQQTAASHYCSKLLQQTTVYCRSHRQRCTWVQFWSLKSQLFVGDDVVLCVLQCAWQCVYCAVVCASVCVAVPSESYFTASQCNTLQHTATHGNSLGESQTTLT